MSSTTPATAALDATLKVQQKDTSHDEPTRAAVPSSATQSVEERRLARLALNRQAAQNSRQRKRDRVQSLEAAVVNLHQVNMLLRKQNAALRRRIHVDETPAFPASQSGLFQAPAPVNARVLENASHREMLVKVALRASSGKRGEDAVRESAEDAFAHGARPGPGAGYGSSGEEHEHVPGLGPAGGDQEHMEGQYGAMSAEPSRGRVTPVHVGAQSLQSNTGHSNTGTAAGDGFAAAMFGLLAGQLGFPGGVAGGEEEEPGMVRMQGTMAAPGMNPLMQRSMSMPHDATRASAVAHRGAAGGAVGGKVADTYKTHSGPGAECAESAYSTNSVYSTRSAPAAPTGRQHEETTAGLLEALVAAMSGSKNVSWPTFHESEAEQKRRRLAGSVAEDPGDPYHGSESTASAHSEQVPSVQSAGAPTARSAWSAQSCHSAAAAGDVSTDRSAKRMRLGPPTLRVDHSSNSYWANRDVPSVIF